MAIGSTIDYSIPTVGSTVAAFDKSKDGLFVEQISVSSVNVPMRLELRTSPLGSLRRAFGGSLKFTPQVLDVPSVATKGRITVSLNVDAYLGSAVDDTTLMTYTRWFLSTMLKSTLLETLRDGSLQ